MVGNYPVITLCGSTRFKNAFIEAQKRLTLEGYIVISVGLFGHSGDDEVWENMPENTVTRTKAMLDDMHKRKIDMADEIYVLNVNDYIGQSTRSEIAYARAHGKIVRFLEPHVDDVRQAEENSTGEPDPDQTRGAGPADITNPWLRESHEQFEQDRRQVRDGLRDVVTRAQQESRDTCIDDTEDGDEDYAELEAVMRQAMQVIGAAGVASPEDATAALIAYQMGEDGGADGYSVDLSEQDENDPMAAKEAYALQMLRDGYDIGNTAYFIGEDERFVRGVMTRNGITEEDLIRFQQQ